MKKLFLFFFFAIIANAQTHRFIYEMKFKPDSAKADYRSENMVLDINPDDVKFYPYQYAENDSLNKTRDFKNTIWDDLLPTIKRKKNTNKNVEFILMDNYFQIESTDEMVWKLFPETKTVGQYTLQKATTVFGGRHWTAWFNNDIVLSEGPYKFRGLPGLIFEIYDDKENYYFSLLKSIKLPKTYDTSEFLETFAQMKPFATTTKILDRKKLEQFENPLRDLAENFKNSNGSGQFWVMGIQVKSMDQFRDLNIMTQDRIRLENNPIELDKAIHYPKK